MSATNGHALYRPEDLGLDLGPPPPQVYTAWGPPGGPPLIFRRGTEPPTIGRVPGAPPDPSAVPLFSIEAIDWDQAKAAYFRYLARRTTNNY